ncbi:cupin domain-containing protein [uncultured Pseudoteredinibacter sp.]|uniref:cupin domain-containing protein n=1 Tax=uncultured Pseudoteredinibacter sp. TaxID=1641701 RepID=UPI00262B73A9|nr:cupin domain-containing protein [uncultured Pseudoteredinibacter sp.]
MNQAVKSKYWSKDVLHSKDSTELNANQNLSRPVNLNTNAKRQAYVSTNNVAWQNSPALGVVRKPLARRFSEHGHATSIVCYEAGSSFSSHSHPGGEEILVLEGIFSDEHGHYPAGSYIRNPAGSIHQPYSDSGCTLFVKLHQFQESDQLSTRIDSGNNKLYHQHSPAHSSLCLHEHKREAVYIQRYLAGSSHQAIYSHGVEILLLKGSLQHGERTLLNGDWLRLPAGSPVQWTFLEDCEFWIKEGHLGL